MIIGLFSQQSAVFCLIGFVIYTSDSILSLLLNNYYLGIDLIGTVLFMDWSPGVELCIGMVSIL